MKGLQGIWRETKEKALTEVEVVWFRKKPLICFKPGRRSDRRRFEKKGGAFEMRMENENLRRCNFLFPGDDLVEERACVRGSRASERKREKSQNPFAAIHFAGLRLAVIGQTRLWGSIEAFSQSA